MKTQYVLQGWHLSYFSGKVRAYMRYKGLYFEDKAVNAYDLTVRIPKKTGATVMPVVQTNKGEWLQDTTAIIQELERRHPEKPVFPSSPTQLIAALIIEAWADEWWIPVAMHYRWSFAENYPLFERDAGTALLPYAPKFVRNALVKKSVAGKMRSYLPAVGITPEQRQLLESWTTNMLDLLDAHFAEHDYLFGGQATVADFALVGPLYGHLNRDPMPKRELLDCRPHLQAWVNRVHNGDQPVGELLANDQIPATLAPIFACIFSEFYGQIAANVVALKAHVQSRAAASGDRIPRSLDTVRFPMAGGDYGRAAMPYTVWMAQMIRDRYLAMPLTDKTAVNAWLSENGHADLMQMELGPALKRHALATRLA